MEITEFNLTLLVGAAVILAAIAAVTVTSRLGMPLLLGFIGLGLLLGEDVLGVEFDDAETARMLGLAALVVILVEGGLATEWRVIRPVVPAAIALSTVGVAISVAVVATGAHFLLDLDWRLSLLLGAIVSSTDAAAVFSALRTLPLPHRLAGVLEAESGFNDAPSVILVTLFSVAALGPGTVGQAAPAMLYELALGTVVGIMVGFGTAAVLRRVALPSSGLYPLAALTSGVLAFALAESLHASGFVAAYLTGLVLGNSRLPHRPAVRSFAEGMAWIAQIGLFVMLGLLATPRELTGVILPALVIGAVLLLIARPLSVVVSLAPLTSLAPASGRFSWREQTFLSWAGLRGAVPIVLATIPIGQVAGADRLFNIVFVLVVVFTLLQGPTLPWLARRLRLASPLTRHVEIESAPLVRLDAELLTLTIPSGSRLHGVEIFELRLPEPAAVTLVVRDGTTLVPDRYTRLHIGDQLLVVATEAVRRAVEHRLQEVSRGGRLARWLA